MSEPTTHLPLIVGVGASAGGVDALGRLFDGIHNGDGMAFVVLTHLAPGYDTYLAEILARHTSMRVVDAVDGTPVRANHVYILPPDATMTLTGGHLRLHKTDPLYRSHHPIDVFFTSTAEEAHERAIGIVLSGSGSDGTIGIRAIKEQGGLTIAQGRDDDSRPEFAGMPSSAIATGLVDCVLPVEQIGVRLEEYARKFPLLQSLVTDLDSAAGHHEKITRALKEICSILRKRVGHDFGGYKEKTFTRRVQRRMTVLQIVDIADYAAHLRNDPNEAGLLFRDLLIGVTSFFRDPEAFEELAKRVVPRLFENTGVGDTVRVWVAGCATGEEAYSFAILLREYMLTLTTPPKVLVFATDIDEAALGVARIGRYRDTLLENVSQARLNRFFHPETAGRVVTKEIREMCIFSAHNVIRDPPFSRIDLISCRNLLIYFNSELQDDVLPMFHYALKPGGILFLGRAEGVSRYGDLFELIRQVDKKHRIFLRRTPPSTRARLPTWISRGRGMSHRDIYETPGAGKDQRLPQQVADRIRHHFAPPHIVVEADGNIVYYSARTGKYLEPQMGSPNRQLLSMARSGLRLELRNALREAVEQRRQVIRERVDVEMEDRVQPIRLTIEPLVEGDQEPLYLVVFADLGPSVLQADAASQPLSATETSGMEQELKDIRERLQVTVEEYETALEELKSGNEELISVNEELQSTNEELETSKEELQSVNEELNTVNNELNSKIEELHHANTDLYNLFESTQVATVFLDRHMVIRNYTPAITAVFNLIPSDRGRPLTDIAHQIEDVDLRSDIRQVLNEHKPLERPVRLRDGKVFHLMRIVPYRTASDEIDGVLVTFVNVTAVVVAEEQQRVLVAELNHRVRNMLQVVIGLANQTLHRSDDLKGFEKGFMGRMQALSRAYQLLSRDGWHNVPLKELLRSQLASFAADGRYTASGRSVVLTANAALAFGLIFYELATNATKYGALSNSSGHIDVSWELDGDSNGQFELQWIERDGPPVSAPTHHGFGSELIQRQLRYELNGKVAMNFAESGVRITVAVPASQVIPAEQVKIAKQNGMADEGDKDA